jgi:hypothetical protein
VWEEDDEVWLNSGRDLGVLGDGLDGVQGTLTKGSILLVGQLLGENIDGPVEECCQREFDVGMRNEARKFLLGDCDRSDTAMKQQIRESRLMEE